MRYIYETFFLLLFLSAVFNIVYGDIVSWREMESASGLNLMYMIDDDGVLRFKSVVSPTINPGTINPHYAIL